jgi:SH3 domain-containing YSC84-like protein 1
MSLNRNALLTTLLVGTSMAVHAADLDEVNERLQNAATVVTEIQASPEKGIPEDLLAGARCAVIVPSLKKGGFVVTARYGKGFLTCREQGSMSWSAPASVRIEGGGVGFQAGAAETDLILLVMNDKGAQTLMESQFTMGGEGQVSAGPVGRTVNAQTDAKLTAGILSWSRSRGAFAGVSLQGATLREDKEDNAVLYGKEMTTKEVVNAKLPVPAGAQPLMRALTVSAAANADRVDTTKEVK